MICLIVSHIGVAVPQVSPGGDYFNESYFRYEDFIYQPFIKTVQLHRTGFELSNPLIRLNSDERLLCTFDDLDGDVKDYRYTVIHCGANWQSSNLVYTEYLSGYEENPVTEFNSSFNTVQPYTNYRFMVPSEDMQLLISGNYLLKVYLAGETEPVFTRRFMVADPGIGIDTRIKRPTVVEDRESKQEIDFSIITQGFSIEDPYRSLHVAVLQNNRWDNAIQNLKPRMVIDNTLNYNYERENVFDGGNEYRDFDIKSLTYRSLRIKSIAFENDTHQVVLWEDEPRSFRVYHSEADINGRYLVSCEDAHDIPTECDYMNVHFFLSYPQPFDNGSMYVVGALTSNQFTRDGLMVYNPVKKGYEADLYLKQGFYNYQYVFLGNNSSRGDATLVEGNHFETQNEYMILVYYRQPGSVHDVLIGASVINSPF